MRAWGRSWLRSSWNWRGRCWVEVGGNAAQVTGGTPVPPLLQHSVAHLNLGSVPADILRVSQGSGAAEARRRRTDGTVNAAADSIPSSSSQETGSATGAPGRARVL